MIPERVYSFTSATFEKKKAKQYETPYGIFTYRDVPSEAYPIGVHLYHENGYGFQIASPEKAICDVLYTISPLRNRAELEHLLFDDLRLDQDDFFRLNMVDLHAIAINFRTQNHKLLQTYINRKNRSLERSARANS